MKKLLAAYHVAITGAITAYQYVVVRLAKNMPLTNDEIFDYRVDVASGKLTYLKPGLSEANKLIHLLGLSVGFDKSGKFWWAEDENGEYMRGKSLEEVVLLIAVVYNSEHINNFKPEYELDATELDTQT